MQTKRLYLRPLTQNDKNEHRIIASIDPDNLRSMKLVERMGFRKEAHFQESLFINGKWVDDVIYALLEKDWVTPKEIRDL